MTILSLVLALALALAQATLSPGAIAHASGGSGGGHGQFSEWSGFRPPTEVSSHFQHSAEYIFQILTPDGPLAEVVESEAEAPVDLTAVARSQNAKELSRALQLAVCQHQKLQHCPILSRTNTGTAFMIANSYTVATTLRNVQTWVHYAIKYNPGLSARRVSLPVILLNAKGEIVAESYSGQNEMRLELMNSSSWVFAQPYDELKRHTEQPALYWSEYVEISSRQALARRALSIQAWDFSQNHALLGFPNQPDAKGLQASSARVEGEGPNYPLLSSSSNTLVGTGSPGSPLLDSEGHVVGMLISSACNHGGECQAVFLRLELDTLRKLWGATFLSANRTSLPPPAAQNRTEQRRKFTNPSVGVAAGFGKNI